MARLDRHRCERFQIEDNFCRVRSDPRPDLRITLLFTEILNIVVHVLLAKPTVVIVMLSGPTVVIVQPPKRPVIVNPNGFFLAFLRFFSDFEMSPSDFETIPSEIEWLAHQIQRKTKGSTPRPA